MRRSIRSIKRHRPSGAKQADIMIELCDIWSAHRGIFTYYSSIYLFF